jgi:hypothetical protein
MRIGRAAISSVIASAAISAIVAITVSRRLRRLGEPSAKEILRKLGTFAEQLRCQWRNAEDPRFPALRIHLRDCVLRSAREICSLR